MEETLLKRVMPHSTEAEQSVIGAMLMDRDAVTVASEMLVSDDFYQKQYGILFDAMIELYTEDKPIDIITLQNRLREKDVPSEISSMEFVRDMITSVPTSANVKYYAQIVSEKAQLRRLIKVSEEIASSCYAGKESTEAIMEDTEKKIFQVLQRKSGEEFMPIREIVLNALDK
ncbi:MAG: replicative DNA helicase, partial [Lachnospiraceae bacterium]|nr:replicative DNA helicase [Lachnospiraceae bacterium]